jgi:hypothetical protein
MKLIQRLLSRTGGNRRLRGLSTAELVGIIVIVGILGAIGGTYINGLVGAAKNNSGNQNAQSLNTVLASAFAAGATCDNTGSPSDPGTAVLDTSTSAASVAQLIGSGVVVNGVTYKMSPPVGTPASYVLATAGTATPLTASFSFTTGATP